MSSPIAGPPIRFMSLEGSLWNRVGPHLYCSILFLPVTLCYQDGDDLAEVSGVHPITWAVSLVIPLQHSTHSGMDCHSSTSRAANHPNPSQTVVLNHSLVQFTCSQISTNTEALVWLYRGLELFHTHSNPIQSGWWGGFTREVCAEAIVGNSVQTQQPEWLCTAASIPAYWRKVLLLQNLRLIENMLKWHQEGKVLPIW